MTRDYASLEITRIINSLNWLFMDDEFDGLRKIIDLICEKEPCPPCGGGYQYENCVGCKFFDPDAAAKAPAGFSRCDARREIELIIQDQLLFTREQIFLLEDVCEYVCGERQWVEPCIGLFPAPELPEKTCDGCKFYVGSMKEMIV